tara:strand:+ start:354 stop:743 length:390 start_codon:yes stop_codon:yes gene_type:complete
MAAQEQAQIAKSSTKGRAARADPKQPVEGSMLFSHGPQFGLKFGASMSHLHFTDPAKRDFGALSQDRVHKTFFFGSKHIDKYVPKVSPAPRTSLYESKLPVWAGSGAPKLPVDAGMYTTMSKISYGQGC